MAPSLVQSKLWAAQQVLNLALAVAVVPHSYTQPLTVKPLYQHARIVHTDLP